MMGRVREVSATGIYHVTVRSVGKMTLFEDDDDRRYFLRLLKKYQRELGVIIHAWVLMDDHVHLVLNVGEGEVPSAFMKRVDVAYAMHFNERTKHTGHVFQGDYGSKPITTNEQLMATVDYIHRNPERAGISAMETYRWSSFQEYAGKLWVVDTSLVLALFGSVEAMVIFHARSVDVVRTRRVMTDPEVLKICLEMAGAKTSGELRSAGATERDTLIRRLSERGVNGKQISRVLGVGTATVSRVLNDPTER